MKDAGEEQLSSDVIYFISADYGLYHFDLPVNWGQCVSQTKTLPRVNGGLDWGTCVGCQLNGNCTWDLSQGYTVCDTGASGSDFIVTVWP